MISNFIETTFWSYLETKAVRNLRELKKHIQSIFKSKGLDIVIQSNIKIVNYLDITLNLNDSTYRPYHKPGNEITYIHKESNHLPNVIKQIPLTIEFKLTTLSSNEEICNESVHIYEDALKKSGYNHKLTYTKNTNNTRKNRNRNVIWFHPTAQMLPHILENLSFI